MQEQNKQPKPSQAIPLLELYAYNATSASRKLLKKYGKADAKGFKDLQEKLKQLYASQSDIIKIEKDFAEIHPHREFILKYLTPPPAQTKVVVQEPTSALEGEKTKPATPGIQINPNVLIVSMASVTIVGIIALTLIYNKK